MPRKTTTTTGVPVKAAGTDVPVDNTIAALRTLLRRYKAVGFGTQEDATTGDAVLSFAILTDGGPMPIQIPVRPAGVYRALWGNAKGAQMEPRRRAQAERVAWRQVYVIVEALLAAHAMGILTLAEAFMAHVLVVDQDDTGGRPERFADFLQRRPGSLTGGARLLLPAGGGK